MTYHDLTIRSIHLKTKKALIPVNQGFSSIDCAIIFENRNVSTDQISHPI